MVVGVGLDGAVVRVCVRGQASCLFLDPVMCSLFVWVFVVFFVLVLVLDMVRWF